MIKGLLLSAGLTLFAALPGTSNYELRDYGFGSGGGSAETANYGVEGIAGDLSGSDLGSTNYGLRPGLLGSQLASLPDAPGWQNSDDWYNKLELTLDTGGNPSDATYAVAISTDNFATTQYVQSDNTVGPALGLEDFRTYGAWGGISGTNVIGLTPSTTYEVKAKARQGEFSETGFGPSASAATAQAGLVFDIDVAGSDIETSPPYAVAFGNVPPGTVTDSPVRIWLDLDSNAESGSFVYVVASGSGLISSSASYTIGAVTGDLSSLNEGIGAQSISVTQSAGGPLTAPSPFNGISANVGAVDTQFKQLLSSSAPLDDGRASFLLKIKTSGTTPAANDYAAVYTLVATAAF